METSEDKKKPENLEEKCGEICKDDSTSVDDILAVVGEFGRFQPPWRCVRNSSICLWNTTFASENRFRCVMPRSEWEYTTSKDFSVVTQFDIGCSNALIKGLPTSIFFLGWLFGAVVMGWCADNFGRKKMIYLSTAVIIFTGIITPFMPNFYGFLVLRFITGFFMQGSFTQMIILISELVGNKHRTLVNTLYFSFGNFGLLLLALKAYFIRNWKLLYIVCTAPYVVLLFTYPLVPQSVRFLRVKGRCDEAMVIFKRMARWNKRVLPPTLTLSPLPSVDTNHKSNPLDLFRTSTMATKSCIQGFASFSASVSFYVLLLGAGDITGHLYRDYVIVTAIDTPMLFFTNYILEKWGRKTSAMSLMLTASCMCIALGFTPKTGKIKELRIVLAMIGKTCTGSSALAMSVWSLELYATNIRSEGLAFLQIASKIGATSAIWIEKELTRIHKGSAHFLIGGLFIVSFCLLKFLPEMQGVLTQDVETVSHHGGSKSEEIDTDPFKVEMKVTSYTNSVNMNE